MLPQVVNQHLLADLTRAGLWTRDLKNELVAANGSVQVRCQPLHLTVVPNHWVPLDICNDRWWRACAWLRKLDSRSALPPRDIITFFVRGLRGTLYFQLLLSASGIFSLLQDLDIPDHMKELYKTVWEIKQKVRT